MAELVTLLGQQLDRQLPTVVTQATTWWEAVLVHVKLQDKVQQSGLRIHLSVKVCCIVHHKVKHLLLSIFVVVREFPIIIFFFLLMGIRTEAYVLLYCALTKQP